MASYYDTAALFADQKRATHSPIENVRIAHPPRHYCAPAMADGYISKFAIYIYIYIYTK